MAEIQAMPYNQYGVRACGSRPMCSRAIVVALAIGAIAISALTGVALVNPTPRLVELAGCEFAGAVFVNPNEVAAVLQGSTASAVLLRGNSQPIPACGLARAVAEKLGRVRRLED